MPSEYLGSRPYNPNARVFAEYPPGQPGYGAYGSFVPAPPNYYPPPPNYDPYGHYTNPPPPAPPSGYGYPPGPVFFSHFFTFFACDLCLEATDVILFPDLTYYPFIHALLFEPHHLIENLY